MAALSIPLSSDVSYDDTVKTIERWNQTGASDEEKLQFLEGTINGMGGLKTIDLTETELEDLARDAVDDCNTCYLILEMLKDLAFYHPDDYFPDILPFLQQWESYSTAWGENLTLSKSFAYQSAEEYNDYASLLRRVDEITTKEDMQRLAAELKEFAEKNPVDIPVDFKDNFLDLQRDLKDFQKRFHEWADNLVFVDPVGLANKASNEIDTLKAEIKRSNRQITEATTALTIPPWWALLSFPFPSHLQVLVSKRKEKQKELHHKLVVPKTSKNYVDSAEGLRDLTNTLDYLAPDFYRLDIFADIWNEFHNEASDFATKFEKVENPSSLPSLYKARIKAALDATGSLVDGLSAYADAIW